MSTNVSYIKGGVKLQCNVSSYPAPRPQGAWPIPAFADAESSLIGLTLVAASGSAISNILVQSTGPLPGSTSASWTVSDQAYQGTAPNPLPVAQSIPVILSSGQNLTFTIINPMAGATHNVWLTRIDAGKVTVFPCSTITTPADPTQAAITTAQTTANTANTNANTANTNASAAQTTANNAASAASAAQTALAAIANQNVLTAGEKPSVIIDYNALTGGQSGIDAQAAAYGVSHTAFDTAVSTLTSYLTGLSPAWNDCTQNTLIVGSTFQTNWVNAYTAQQALLNLIYAAAQTLAQNAQTTANSAQTTANSANSTANTAASNATTALGLVPAIVSYLPTLPNASYPANKLVMCTGGSPSNQLYQVNAAGTGWITPQTAASNVSGTIPAAQIGAGLTASQISSVNAAAVGAGLTASQISSVNAAAVGNGITGSQIAASTITGGNIVGSTITGGNIAGSTITGSNIAGTTITGANIVGQTITAAQIASGTITASQIAANTITAGQIAANTITASQIAAGTIGAAQIAANSITASQIAGNTITGNQIATNFEVVAGQIYSPNYVANSTGWCITAAGSADFTNSLQAGGMSITTIVSQLEYAYAYAQKGGGGCCVRADSMVMGLTEDKPISEIKLRDNIIAYDFDKKDSQVCNVVGRVRTLRDSHYQVKTEDGTELFITGDHPIYSSVNGWSIIGSLDEFNTYKAKYNLNLSNLIISDNIFCFGGLEESVSSINSITNSEIMYTLRVNHKDHNYYANGVLVHNGGGGACLAGDTMVETPDGDRRLASININDMVYCFVDNHKVALPVTACVEVFHRVHYQIRFTDGRTLRISEDHPVLTPDGWKSIDPLKDAEYRVFQLELKQLQVGDEVVRPDGVSKVKSIAKIRGDVELYTIGTRGGNTFIANGLIVHDNYSPV